MRQRPPSSIGIHLCTFAPLLAATLALLTRWRTPPLPLALTAYGVAAGLWVVGLTFGILVLAGGRTSGRRRVPARAILGLTVCLLLLFWTIFALQEGRGLLPWGSHRSQVTAGSDYDATRPIVDEDYRFELSWPGKGWKLLREQDVQHLVPDAVAGAVGRGGYYGVVIVENAPGLPLEPLARLSMDNMQLEGKKVESFRRTRLADQEVVRATVSGAIKGVKLRYLLALLIRDGFAYQLNAWAPLDQVPPDGASLEPFFSAFKLLPGKIRGRQRQRGALSATGPGWRLQRGSFESAAYGFRVQPRGRWRVVVGNELETMNTAAEVGMVHQGPDVYCVLLLERAPGVEPEVFTRHLSRTMSQALKARGASELLTATVDGEAVTLNRFRAESRMEFLHGIRRRGDLYLQVLVWYVETLREGSKAAVQEALASIQFLGKKHNQTLGAALDKSYRLQASVGPTHALRRGVFRSFAEGFSWSSPGGLWRVHAGERARTFNPAATLVIEEPGLGLWGMVIAEPPPPGVTLVGYHQAARASFLAETAPRAGGAARPSRAGNLPTLASLGDVWRTGFIYRYHISTAIGRARGYKILFWGFPRVVDRSEPTIARALAGFSFHPQGLRPTAERDGRFEDHRFGFRYHPPDPSWRRRETMPQKLKGLGTQVTWTSGKQQALILAVISPTSDENQRWFTDFIEQFLREDFGRMVMGEPRRSAVTLDGRPARHLSWRGLRGTVDAFLVAEGSILYALVRTSELSWSRGSLASLQAGFAFLD